MVRLLPFLLVLACGRPISPSGDLDPDVDPVTEGSWVRPELDATWQWQLQGTVNTSYDAQIYDVDLFDSPASLFDGLHDDGRTVFCYFSAGSYEDWREDADDFEASDVGRKLGGWAGEWWVDVRSANVQEIMRARLELAAERGCDGVEPDNVTAYDTASGFDLSAEDQIAYNRFLANTAHELGLSIALKNDGDQVPELVDYFDLSVNEECHAYDECEQLAPFVDAGKPILNAEYPGDRDDALAAKSSLCAAAEAHGTRTLLLPLELDDSFRVACDE